MNGYLDRLGLVTALSNFPRRQETSNETPEDKRREAGPSSQGPSETEFTDRALLKWMSNMGLKLFFGTSARQVELSTKLFRTCGC